MTLDPTRLGNVMWRCLSGSHAHLAEGVGAARRYQRGFSPLLGFADPENPDFSGLDGCTQSGEQFYCAEWTGDVPPGWRLLQEATMLRMVDTGALAISPEGAEAPVWRALTAVDAEAALALALKMRPGPFGPRTLELGDYLGIFDNDALVAMAGERMQAGPWREISGVCTAPGYGGRGLAVTLMKELMRRQRSRGEGTFLHVMSSNTVARRLYEGLGFRAAAEVAVRVLERL